jgi:hypothetical protein
MLWLKKGRFAIDDELVGSLLEATLHPQNHDLNIHSFENLISIIINRTDL